MLASALALGLVSGLALGGRLERLRSLSIAWVPLLAGAVGLRLVAPVFDELAPLAYVAAFAGVTLVALRNRWLPGMAIVAVGAALNLVVVAANGAMPVDPGAAIRASAVVPSDPLHEPLDATTSLSLLADLIPVPFLRAVYSAGDVLLSIGGAVLAFRSVRP